MFFLLVFNVLQGSFPTFVFVKKLALRSLFLLGFFMGVWGVFASLMARVFYCIWLVFSILARFFCGWFWKRATGSRCLPGFWGGIRSRGLQRGGGRLAGRLRFCSSGRGLARGVRIGRGWRGRGRCCFVVGWLLRRGVCGFFAGVWALLCRRR